MLVTNEQTPIWNMHLTMHDIIFVHFYRIEDWLTFQFLGDPNLAFADDVERVAARALPQNVFASIENALQEQKNDQRIQ